MRYIVALIFVLYASAASAGMTCGTRSVPNAATYESCVSPDYAPSISLVNGAASTADTYSNLQWPMRQILEGESYDSLFDDAPRDVKVAVIDTYPGNQGHPDLVNVYEPGINLIEGGTNTNPAPWDGLSATSSNAHGQCVASVIAAEHNSIGVAGVFHRARIIPIRASFDNLDVAIDKAVEAGAEVIHIAGFQPKQDMSTPGAAYNDYSMWPNYYAPDVYPLRWMMRDVPTATYEKARLVAIRAAVERAAWDHNVIVSTVVGNWTGADATVMLPSIHETIVTMAVNVLGEPSPFNSNYHGATILAPGGDRRAAAFSVPHSGDVIGPNQYANPDDVMCALGPNKYSWGSGGSFAGPHVAGAAAIVKSYLPDATPDDVRRLLTRSRQPIMQNLHLLQGVGGMLSLKRLRAAINNE